LASGGGETSRLAADASWLLLGDTPDLSHESGAIMKILYPQRLFSMTLPKIKQIIDSKQNGMTHLFFRLYFWLFIIPILGDVSTFCQISILPICRFLRNFDVFSSIFDFGRNFDFGHNFDFLANFDFGRNFDFLPNFDFGRNFDFFCQISILGAI